MKYENGEKQRDSHHRMRVEDSLIEQECVAQSIYQTSCWLNKAMTQQYTKKKNCAWMHVKMVCTRWFNVSQNIGTKL